MPGQKIKINCTDFSSDGLRFNNYIFKLIAKYYDVEISDSPEILLYSSSGQEFRRYDCLRIFYTGENTRPNFKECDYAFSFDHSDDPRNYRFPDYAAYEDIRELVKIKDVESIVRRKTSFCEFTYSNPVPQERIRFFKALSKYKRVDSFGKVLNNTPDVEGSAERYSINWKEYRRAFLAPYKFSVAFENESFPGYVTEKILYAMLTNAIAIYWGNPVIFKDFNTKSFINCHEYENFDLVIQRVIEIDNDNDLYRQYLAEPYYKDNRIPDDLTEERIVQRLESIISNKDRLIPVARQRATATKTK
jgi:alpha(1,3/1,4) fucosyltransferase